MDRCCREPTIPPLQDGVATTRTRGWLISKGSKDASAVGGRRTPRGLTGRLLQDTKQNYTFAAGDYRTFDTNLTGQAATTGGANQMLVDGVRYDSQASLTAARAYLLLPDTRIATMPSGLRVLSVD